MNGEAIARAIHAADETHRHEPWSDVKGSYRAMADAAIAVMQDQWQPIEAAPDGESVLCVLKHGIGLVIAHRADDEIYGDSGNDWTGSVTHWMPLPPVPEASR